MGAAIFVDAPLFARNLLLVVFLACVVGALALTKAEEGALPSGWPLIAFGVAMLVIGPPAAYWTYGDAFAASLRLEFPIRAARLLVHSGYAFLVAGLTLLACSVLGTPARRQPEPADRTVSAGEASPLHAALQTSLHMVSFQLKVGFAIALALLAIISAASYLGMF